MLEPSRRPKVGGQKATEVKGEGKSGGRPVAKFDGRENLKGGANYQSGGKRDMAERLYVKKS